MRKQVFGIALLFSILCVPFVVKTKHKKHLVTAPVEIELQSDVSKKVVEQQCKPSVEPVKKESKKESALSQKTKKSQKKTFTISDAFRTRERGIPGTLGYKHWTGWHYPTKFIMKLNNVEILAFDGKEFTRKNATIDLDVQEPFVIHFDWEFLNGRRQGWRTITFKLDQNAQAIDLDFDWKDEWQVLVKQAKPVSSESSDNKDSK
jgi:hypothetical protein